MVKINGEKFLTYYEVMERIKKSYVWVRRLIITRGVKTFTIAGQGNYRFIRESDVAKIMAPLATKNGVPQSSVKIMQYKRDRAKRLQEKADGERQASRDNQHVTNSKKQGTRNK